MMKALGDLISGECLLPGSQMMPYCSNLTCQKGFPDSSVGKNMPSMQEIPVQFLGWEDLLEKGQATHSLQYSWASLLAQLVKNLPTMRETWV